ncbi:MAG TPA: DUF892 family protein [Hymenobacter sp.]|jgi:ferritin-like metal-binding protein YciE
MSHIRDLRDLLDHEVQAMYSAEKLIAKGLPRLINEARSPELKQAFQLHLEETESQVERLERVADLLEIDADGDKNLGMAGILAEGEQVMHKDATPEAMDAALICGAQKIEHYEIAGYGTAVYLAQELGFEQAASILDGILMEEKKTNALLNQLAKNLVNPLAE